MSIEQQDDSMSLTEALCAVIEDVLHVEGGFGLSVIPTTIELSSGMSGPVVVAQAYLADWIRDGDAPPNDDEEEGSDGEWIASYPSPDPLTAVISLIHNLLAGIDDEEAATALERAYVETIVVYGNPDSVGSDGQGFIAPFGYRIASTEGE